MGLNMPARTVIFTTLQKWDGSAKRFVSSGEYIQMSGRAGRRGKDTHGTCIILAEDELDAAKCEEITFGKPSPLKSSFKLSYYTLLNLMRRVEGGTEGLEYVISNSFQQFQQNQRRPEVRVIGWLVDWLVGSRIECSVYASMIYMVASALEGAKNCPL